MENLKKTLFEWDERTILSVLIIIAAYFLGRQIPRWMAGVPLVKPAEAKQAIDNDPDTLVLDVRMAHQFTGKDGHIQGALNLPHADVWHRVRQAKNELSQFADTPVLVVCKNDQLSSRIARVLRKNGLTRIAVLDGGLKA
ncbi:MAG: rhodanese-like domain-containing protein [Rhodospirillaceae bacterium]